MPVSLDLNFLPLVRQNGVENPVWPGLYVAVPPRGAARGRDIDLLALYLSVGGTSPLPAGQLEQLMPRLAQVYYRTSGTATAALKAVVDELNRILLERNLRASNTGQQGVGSLTQVVLRGDMLYLAHSGTVQTYLLKPEGTTLWVDDVGGGRGLGVSRTASVRYFHAGLQPGDYLVFTHRPAAGWNVNTVHSQPNQGMEGLRRSLLAYAGADLQAVLVQVLAGDGKLRLLRLKSLPAQPSQPAAVDSHSLADAGVAPANQPAGEVVGLAGESIPGAAPMPPEEADLLPGRDSFPDSAESQPVQPTPSGEAQAGVSLRGAAMPTARPSPTSLPGKPAPPTETERAKPAPRLLWQPLQQRLRAGFQATGRLLGRFFQMLGELARRILPDETLLNISPSMLVFLAILLPVVISVLGGMMYIQRGQALQHADYLSKAQVAVDRALASEAPDEQRSNWRLALNMLDQAEFYSTTEASTRLRQQAQGTLDTLDGVERLDFRPALLSSLGDTVHITRLAAQPGELYLLDGPSGRVLRALWAGGAFQLDRSFECGPVSGTASAGPLIDLAIPPRNNEDNAVVVGMDAGGNLVLCIPGKMPVVKPLAPPPMNFRTPKSFTLSGNDLYVLDPGNNGVWIYWNMSLTEQPRLFFGDQVPYMQDVVDLVVNGEDLYLLHSNGSQTWCTYSLMEVSPTRCEDAVPYRDARPGRQDGPVIPDSLFDQIYFAPPPDPSLYLLDPANQAVFHFSLRLNFQQQYRSTNELPDAPLSAFAVSSDRLIFMAVKNQVYFAALP